jgi:DNA-binding Lrp family transcriptional regulator
MDSIDAKIICELSKSADMTATELSKKLNFSVPAVNKRIRAMKNSGVIQKFTIVTDNKKIGKPIIAFVLIILKSIEHTDAFFEYVSHDPDVLECYATTGEYDYLIKVVAKDVEELEEKLLFIKGKRGVIKSHTMLALCEHKFKATVI